MKNENKMIVAAILILTTLSILSNSQDIRFSQITGLATEPPRFSDFYGTVKCQDGTNIGTGTIVAKVSNGVDTTETQKTISLGKYFISVTGFSLDEASLQDNISFYLNDELLAGNITFEFWNLTQLNLVSVTNSYCQQDLEDEGDGNGGGGGGGTPQEYTQCNDGLDNDQDGCIDYPKDPGCLSFEDNYEGELSCKPIPCQDQCDLGDQICFNDSGYIICRNYNLDPCLEWSHVFECPNNTACDSGFCRTSTDAPTTELPKTTELELWKFIIPLSLLIIAITGFLFFKRRRKKEEKKKPIKKKKKRKKKHK
ncbi:MAG: hypothetical protein ABH849_00990 [Nanoarchaeota archaeon]